MLVAQELDYFLFFVTFCESFGNDNVIKSDCPLEDFSSSVFLVKASCFTPPDTPKFVAVRSCFFELGF